MHCEFLCNVQCSQYHVSCLSKLRWGFRQIEILDNGLTVHTIALFTQADSAVTDTSEDTLLEEVQELGRGKIILESFILILRFTVICPRYSHICQCGNYLMTRRTTRVLALSASVTCNKRSVTQSNSRSAWRSLCQPFDLYINLTDRHTTTQSLSQSVINQSAFTIPNVKQSVIIPVS